MTSFARPFRGIIPPLATPLLERDRLDHAALERLIEHVIGGGVHGIFILGTTGEGPSLSYRLRMEVIERSCEIVAGRVPVLVGVSDSAYVESVQLAEHAAEVGAQAVVLAPPYYFPAGQSELALYLEHIAAEMPLPVFLYNMPSHTKLNFDLDTLARAMQIANVVGLKDSSGQMIYFHKARHLLSARPDFSILMGPEELMGDAVLLGAHGGVCGGSNLAPRLYVDLYEAASRGDLQRTRELHAQVMKISMTIYSTGPGPSSYLRGLKCALSCMGLCGDVLAEPFQPFGADERARIEKYVRELELDKEAPIALEKRGF
jgi:4-hydroxy-tetrahydrodipicolinate synthase